MTVHEDRVTMLREGTPGRGPVIYWMSRDQRARDNWALAYAHEQATARHVPLAVVFCLVPSFLGATARHYDFMFRGLAETATELDRFGIPFIVLSGDPAAVLPDFLDRHRCGLLVTDFDPLRIKRRWRQAVARTIGIPFAEVDAHNIVPCRLASDKREYGAYTIRKKITSRLDMFLTQFPEPERQPVPWQDTVDAPDWTALAASVTAYPSVRPVTSFTPGETAAENAMYAFIGGGLAQYADTHNDPNADAASGLSPYLHFGQLAPQRVALEVAHVLPPDDPNREAFLEQLIVRRELADNFCLHCDDHDRLDCLPGWARVTLDRHRDDIREYLYSRAELDGAATHDPLWNAAQRRLVVTGRMHNYLRMYWAKKILEWSTSPEEALAAAIFLNDRYQLDGRDPNGYTGILWSIGGLHDRPWNERPVYGTIRYMNLAGARRKFDVDRFIAESP